MTLPEPSFIDRDGAAIRDAIVARVEELLDAPLPPASTERILCEQLAYRETLARIAIQEACKQNLWAYASYPMIDYLAALVGETRIGAKAAVATFRATLPVARAVVSVIPATFAVRSKDGKAVFGLDHDITIAAGALSGTSTGTCTSTGASGNAYIAGAICDLVSRLDFDVAVANIDETGGGTASEATEAMRVRVPQSLSRVSGAGPGDAYESIARGASADVVDAKATRPSDGVVRVTVLAKTGAPSEALLSQVLATYDNETNIPENDTVEVVAATAIEFDLTMSVTLYRPQAPRTPALVIDDTESACGAYVAARGERIGYQVLPNRVENVALSIAEVYDCTVTSTIPVIGSGQFARMRSLTVNLLGFTEEPLQ